MRTLLAAALLACSPEMVTRPSPPPVDWKSFDRPPAPADAGVSAIDKERAAANAFTQGKLADVLYEEAHFRFAGAADVRGREKILREIDALLGRFDERNLATSRVLLAESALSVEWTLTGVHRTTRKPVAIKGLTLLWTKDDGSIADIHLYFDEAVVRAQIGEGPKALQGLPPPHPPAVSQEAEQQRSAEERANAALVRGAIQALEDDNEAAYVGTMTDDVEVATSEGALKGKAAVRTWFRTMHDAIGHLDTLVENAWGIGPFGVVEYSISGEQRKPIGWLVPARKDPLIKMIVADVVETRGGKIARVWRYDNPIEIVSSLEEPKP
jgi:ketosteroid isomerase-like protein